MNTFLKDVALQLIANHPNDLDKTLVVFNNRRPSLFLRREFKQLSDKAIFLPQMIGMDDLIAMLSQLAITPKEYLLFELYDIHNQIDSNSKKASTFESFISLADMMMADFSEIDLYMADAKSLFANLYELKEIGEWNIEEPKLSQSQRDYLSFYHSLYEHYEQLRERLRAQGKAYSGMAYREVAEHIEDLMEKLHYSKIYFVGFSVLSRCEKTIIQALVQSGMAEIITDGDDYYCSQPHQEAGMFFRQLNEWLPKPVAHPSHFGKETKDITIVNCPEDILQAKYAGQLLDEWTRDKAHGTSNMENTAIVLADEGLLLPMLNSLPDGVTSANVTMGFPYQLSGIHAFVLKLLSLHIKAKSGRFHHKDLLDTLSDNYIGLLLGAKNIYPRIQNKFASEKVIYSTMDYIKGSFDSIGIDIKPIEYLFAPIATAEGSENEPHNPANEFLGLCKRLIGQIVEHDILKHNVKERESVNCLLQMVDYLEELQRDHDFIKELSTLEKIYTRLAQRHTVSFYGEPLEGLQILGMLETRNLNFDRIVILSTNEGTLPAGRGNNTLIPFTLKRQNGIPTHIEKDAVYAYHFYRLLQRATDVHILYNTETSGMGKGEPSRFVLQLRTELAEAFPNIHITEKVLSVGNKAPQVEPLTEIAKTPDILGRLDEMAEYGFSPSALNVYLKCPRQFYYQYVLQVGELEELNEELDASEMGNCIHEILNNIHDQGKGEPLTAEYLRQTVGNLDQMVDDTFNGKYLKERNGEGRNQLLSSVAKAQIKRFLESEIEQIEQGYSIVIKDLEADCEFPLRVNIGGKDHDVKIKGRIDRVDMLGHTDKNGQVAEQLRVVDYKSGKVEPKDLNIARDTAPEETSDKWFQLMTYSWLYANRHQLKDPFEAAIIPLSSSKTQYLPAQWGMTKAFGKSDMLDFQEMLQKVVGEMLDPGKKFHSRAEKHCKYCDFRFICPANEE